MTIEEGKTAPAFTLEDRYEMLDGRLELVVDDNIIVAIGIAYFCDGIFNPPLGFFRGFGVAFEQTRLQSLEIGR